MKDNFIELLKKYPFVYHYTKLESLFGILYDYKNFKKPEQLPLRASCIYNVNDPREMELGYNYVKDFLPEFEKNHPQSIHLSEIYTSDVSDKKCLELCNQKTKEVYIESGMIPYTISFSAKRDFLPMWSLYGNHCEGVCLKFNLLELIDKIHSQFGFVVYDGNSDDDYIKNDYFPPLYDFIINEENTNNLSIDQKIDELSILCTCVSPFVKSSYYAYETEFRIVNTVRYGEITEHNIKEIIHNGLPKEMIKPFVYYSMNANALKEIIIGPLVKNYKSIESVIRNELNGCLLNDVDITSSSITIR